MNSMFALELCMDRAGQKVFLKWEGEDACDSTTTNVNEARTWVFQQGAWDAMENWSSKFPGCRVTQVAMPL